MPKVDSAHFFVSCCNTNTHLFHLCPQLLSIPRPNNLDISLARARTQWATSQLPDCQLPNCRQNDTKLVLTSNLQDPSTAVLSLRLLLLATDSLLPPACPPVRLRPIVVILAGLVSSLMPLLWSCLSWHGLMEMEHAHQIMLFTASHPMPLWLG